MQFLVTGHDGTDDQALPRRMAAREAHLKGVSEMHQRGEVLFAVAMLDGVGKMIGSTMIYECPSRAELDAWLRAEPYVTGGVWRNIEVHPCRVGPDFLRGAKQSQPL